VLINDEKMEYELYKHELEELLDEWKLSMMKDNDGYLFAVTENSGDVAMVLIEKAGQVHINELAREKLKALWFGAYESNMKKLIPIFASQLANGEIPVNGIKMVVVA
jgi:hypothetical protein